MLITPTVMTVLKTLKLFRRLRSKHLYAVMPVKDQKWKEAVLRQMFWHGYLDKPIEQRHHINFRYNYNVYELTSKGRSLVESAPSLSITDHTPKIHFLAHAVLISDILFSIWYALKDKPEYQLLTPDDILHYAPPNTKEADNPFKMEAWIDGKRRYIIPDAVFGILYPAGKALFFAVEADRDTEPVYRSTMDVSSFRRKLLGYQYIFENEIHRKQLNINRMMVLTVTTKKSNGDLILETAKKLECDWLAVKHQPGLGDLEDAPAPCTDLFTVPWTTCGGVLDLTEYKKAA